MKTLKNRPKGWGKIGQGKCVVCQDFHEWVDGFEKTAKEFFEDLKQLQFDTIGQVNRKLPLLISRYRKEILGE